MSEPTHSKETNSNSPTLLRALGLSTAMAVVVGNVIGSGIFLKPGIIARDGGDFGLIISVWVLGGVLCILGGLCFAELASMLPRAGGLYVYLRESYGSAVAFLFGWTDFLIRLPGSIAALSVVFVGQVIYVLGWQIPTAGQIFMVAVLIIGMAWVNILGVVWGGRVQLVTTVIKAGVLALVAVAPFVLWPFVEQAFSVSNYSTSVETDPNMSLGTRIGVVLLAVMWAYNGWHGVTPLGEEIKNPQRNIPLALFGGIGILIVLYVGANFAYHGVLSLQEIKDIGLENEAATGKSVVGPTAAAAMFERMIGSIGVALVAGMIMCSTFGAINTNFLQAPRIPFAMGRDGVFFRGLGQVHANYRTPAVAIATSAAIAILLVVTAATAKHLVQGVATENMLPLMEKITISLQKDTIFDLVTNLVIFAASIFYTLAVSAVIILRVKRPELERPYRTWGYPVVPVLFIGVYVWFLRQIYVDKPLESCVGIVLILLGLPVYFYFHKTRSNHSTE